MERLMMQRENGGGSGGSPRTPESDDVDFKDVFGGPPRRFSMVEVRERHSFGESSSSLSPWDKPVFGEEKRPPRQKGGTDFFDDIFRGSPRKSDRDGGTAVFGSNPVSRIMSPARAAPDHLASSLPAQFSLPAKLTKSMDLPTFGSQNHKVEGGSDGLNSPSSWNPFSRFSNEASVRVDDTTTRDEVGEDSPFIAISDQKEKDMRSPDSIGDQFHFSIYKWAGRGVPMLMPLVIGNSLKSSRDGGIRYDKSESKSSSLTRQSSSDAEPDVPLISERGDEGVRSRGRKIHEQSRVFESPESKSKSSGNDSVVLDRNENKVLVKISEGLSSELKSLHASIDQPEMKDKKARASQLVDGDSKKVKENGRKGVDSNNVKKDEKSTLQAQGKSGKVKEFVEIFNQDADSRLEADARGSRRRGNAEIDQIGNEASSNQAKDEEQVNLHNVDKKPDVSFKKVENVKTNEARLLSPRRMSSSTRSSSRLRKSFSAGTLHEDLEMPRVKLDDPLEDNFEVHEISDGNENVAQDEISEETKAIDAKIRQWSLGKKGNIRSLLSTLQYVLWAESGWKPVPLVDLIESNSVKKAYQKALLRLHPDKLQQKGAAFHHKYIAEKVFDILQEAWEHFNTSSSLGI